MSNDPYFLSSGSHPSADEGRCAMEWVAYLAGEPHGDRPVCVSPVLQSYCITLNDKLPDDERQRLRPYLARTIGTAGDGRDEERLQLLRGYLVKTSLPRTLDKIGQHEWAEKLRQLPGPLAAENVRRLALEVRDEARRARSDARAKLEAELRKRMPAAADAAAAAAYAAAAYAAYAYAAYAAAAAAYAAYAAYAAAYAAYAAYAAAYDAAYAAAYAAAYDATKSPQEIYDEVYAKCRAEADERLAEFKAQSRRDAFDLLEQMLPTEVIQLPAVDDAEQVCGVAIA